MKILRLLILSLGLFLSYPVFAGENVFYVLHSSPKHPQALASTLDAINKHAKSIQIIITQAYQINHAGAVTGYINDELVALAKQRSLKLMAMITNAGFDQQQVHQFLSSREAQEKAITDILIFCHQYHLYGVQFDFEMVSVKDKEALTEFFTLAAKRLHDEKFAISYAIIPAFAEKSGHSLFLKKSYQNWSGAYDLKALGQSADFITIMAYNQHPEGTTPGPAAGIDWVKNAIQTALKEMPANKISLGIPSYSLYWFTGPSTAQSKHVSTQRREVDFDYAKEILQKNNSHLIWDNKNKVYYSVYERNWLNEYVYLEDAKSFNAKLKLANQYHLRGVSVFRVGTEDTKIWALFEKKSSSKTKRYKA